MTVKKKMMRRRTTKALRMGMIPILRVLNPKTADSSRISPVLITPNGLKVTGNPLICIVVYHPLALGF